MEDITGKRYENGRPKLRRFRQAKWDEAVIFELSTPGARGVLVPEVEAELATQVGDVVGSLPDGVARRTPPALPEMSQPEVVRHYMRLSQETLGVDFNVDIGQGTCTMKYSPKIHEQFVAMPQVAALHPLQGESTVQGILEVMYGLEGIFKEISGMARFSLQPGAGSAAIYGAASMIRAYHAERGESQRDEVITTYCSHPSDAACAKTAGYKVITLHADENGYPDTEALKAAVSDRTAALFVANPEDTGIFNPRIAEWVQIVHDAGGLCFYDQANVNGIMGITRARDAGFDMCHFNLHKSFSTPHACGGPAVGALGVSEQMIPYLPGPIVCCEDGVYSLQQPPKSIGKVGAFFGSTANFVRAYAWVMNLGADGLRSVAETAVLNNNYLYSKVKMIDGVDACYPQTTRRVEQVRYSWKELADDTGVHSEEIGVRCADFGMHYWTSHHPYSVPEPCTLEPTESYSKRELDEYIQVLQHVAEEARTEPLHVKGAPYNSCVHQIDHASLDDPKEWAITWRAYLKKHRKGKAAGGGG
jgi:glycine dehydrogenase subunit 2